MIPPDSMGFIVHERLAFGMMVSWMISGNSIRQLDARRDQFAVAIAPKIWSMLETFPYSATWMNS